MIKINIEVIDDVQEDNNFKICVSVKEYILQLENIESELKKIYIRDHDLLKLIENISQIIGVIKGKR